MRWDKGSVDIKGFLCFHWNFKMLLKYLLNPTDVTSLKARMKSTRYANLGFQTWSTSRASLTAAVPQNWASPFSPIVCPSIVLSELSSAAFPLTQCGFPHLAIAGVQSQLRTGPAQIPPSASIFSMLPQK